MNEYTMTAIILVCIMVSAVLMGGEPSVVEGFASYLQCKN